MNKVVLGKVRGDKGEQGPQGPQGIQGLPGSRGSRWVCGTAISGIFTDPRVCSETGITDALVNDQYLNSYEGNIYRCCTAGDANTATWVWTGQMEFHPLVQTGETTIDEYDTDNWKDCVFENYEGIPKIIGMAANNDGTHYVAHSSTEIFISANGIKWTKVDVNVDGIDSLTGMSGIACSRDCFVIVSNDRYIIRSFDDGATWVKESDCSAHVYNSIAANEYGVFVAVGEGRGSIEYSTDGEYWSEVNTDGILNVCNAKDIIYDTTLGKFITMGNTSTEYDVTTNYFAYSDDGETWTFEDTGISKTIMSITYYNDILIAVGNNMEIWCKELYASEWVNVMHDTAGEGEYDFTLVEVINDEVIAFSETGNRASVDPLNNWYIPTGYSDSILSLIKTGDKLIIAGEIKGLRYAAIKTEPIREDITKVVERSVMPTVLKDVVVSGDTLTSYSVRNLLALYHELTVIIKYNELVVTKTVDLTPYKMGMFEGIGYEREYFNLQLTHATDTVYGGYISLNLPANSIYIKFDRNGESVINDYRVIILGR